jgi:hypothetical protein
MTQQGVYFISRLKTGTKVYGEDRVELKIPEMLGELRPRFGLAVEVGGQRASPQGAAYRSQGTQRRPTYPSPLAAIEDVLVLARVRWQVELLFKLWKQRGAD